jgi:hypothetical protein
MGVQQGRESLVAVEADPEVARVGQDHREAVQHHLLDADAQAVRAPIHLSLLGRPSLEASKDRTRWLRGSAQLPQVLLEDRQSAAVAPSAQLAKDPWCREVLARHLRDQVVERFEFACRRGRAWPSRPPQRTANGLGIASQSPRDAPNGHVTLEQVLDLLEFV